jgi:hypothetical protein
MKGKGIFKGLWRNIAQLACYAFAQAENPDKGTGCGRGASGFRRDEMAHLKPNLTKIVEAILFLLQEAEKQGRALTQYQIVKSVFIADLQHLRKFGRPISFDNYVAMKFGPVPSETYDLLKASYRWEGEPPAGWPLWDRVPRSGSNVVDYRSPKREPNKRKLSQTDVAELTQALSFVLAQGFGGVRDWTHLLPAYSEAWESRGERKANDMDYNKLLSRSDSELVAELQHASHHM